MWFRFRRSVPLRALRTPRRVLCSGGTGLAPFLRAPGRRRINEEEDPRLLSSFFVPFRSRRAQPPSVLFFFALSFPKKKTKPTTPHNQVLHSITAERLEIVRSIDDHIENQVFPILKDSEACWQPAEFLPDSSSPDFVDEVLELRKRTDQLPDDYFVVLVGDMITEEALPTYMAMLNTLDGVRDETGASPTPWARWTRAWTAEENR